MRRAVAQRLLLAGLGLMLLAWLGTLHVDRHSAHHIWPIHSALLMPLLLAIWAWCCLASFVFAVIMWLIRGDK